MMEEKQQCIDGLNSLDCRHEGKLAAMHVGPRESHGSTDACGPPVQEV
ncbi:hypothetical protein [Rhodobacteraceae bacterium DSL-40]